MVRSSNWHSIICIFEETLCSLQIMELHELKLLCCKIVYKGIAYTFHTSAYMRDSAKKWINYDIVSHFCRGQVVPKPLRELPERCKSELRLPPAIQNCIHMLPNCVVLLRTHIYVIHKNLKVNQHHPEVLWMNYLKSSAKSNTETVNHF